MLKSTCNSVVSALSCRVMATPRTVPVELHAHAMDNLQYIRRTLERAGEFTAVPGKGGVLMGVVGVVASRLAVHQRSAGGWLAVWTYAAIVAMAIGIAGAALKSRRFQTPMFSGPGRKFIAGFAPSLPAGGERCAAYDRFRRAAFDFRYRDRGEIWRVNPAPCGATARSVRSWRPW